MTSEYMAMLSKPESWNSEEGKPQPDTKRQPKGHPAQVPVKNATLGWRPSCGHTEAIERPAPALVLDPFAGTGTTCAAAQRLGRRAVGVDISEAYLEQAVRRLSAVTLPMLNF